MPAHVTPPAALVRARQLLRRAIRLNNAGRFYAAERASWQALLMLEALLGRFDEETVEAVNGLALCRFNAGQYATAADAYRDLHARCRVAYGHDDPLTAIAADRLQACLDAFDGRHTAHRH